MGRRATLLITALIAFAVPAPGVAQVRSSMSARPSTPASPRRPAPAPAGIAAPPFRSGLVVLPRHPPRALVPLRLPWFGLVVFDAFWPFEPDLSGEPGAFGDVAPPFVNDLPTGGLQLDVEPRRAMLYVDGRPLGPVSQFSGYYQHLDLPAGPHHLDFLDADYDPFFIDVVVTPGRTTTYRAALSRR
jgi:hypothetical protein